MNNVINKSISTPNKSDTEARRVRIARIATIRATMESNEEFDSGLEEELEALEAADLHN